MQWSACKPAVPRKWLMALAGVLWAGVGVMLCRLAGGWLRVAAGGHEWMLWALGGVLAFCMYRYVFARLVAKNLVRIEALPKKGCLFAFQPWRSYLLIAFMILLGLGMRRSAVPRAALAIIYITIGGALLIGGLKYWLRVLHA